MRGGKRINHTYFMDISKAGVLHCVVGQKGAKPLTRIKSGERESKGQGRKWFEINLTVISADGFIAYFRFSEHKDIILKFNFLEINFDVKCGAFEFQSRFSEFNVIVS